MMCPCVSLRFLGVLFVAIIYLTKFRQLFTEIYETSIIVKQLNYCSTVLSTATFSSVGPCCEERERATLFPAFSSVGSWCEERE